MAARAFHKVLIANRGEIARRVSRTLRAMGLSSVAVYSDADAEAPHAVEADEAVRIGPAPSAESYLDAERLLAAAEATGAEAVHPGYGFLSESADFAERCAAAGRVWIGPTPESMRKVSRKAEAKALMAAAGVPVVPGVSVGEQEPGALAEACARLGYPVLVKASAGGGGRGMRIVRAPEELDEALAGAGREAAAAFGDASLIVERYLERPRHVEVQVLGDTHGHVVHLFERECSIQRRYQKLVEEAPSPAVDGALRRRLGEAAVAAAKAIGYVGAGTVEFVLDAAGEFFFLEMNTRLQVEHPVTEAVTGLDLVRLQVEVARGEALPFAQEDLGLRGHAVEARLYAEDPARGFLPSTGRIALWAVPELPGLRVDAGVEPGTEVSAHYDALLAKVIAHGAERSEALARLDQGLARLGVGGVATNRALLRAVLRHPAFEEGAIDTHFLERHGLAGAGAEEAADGALLRRHAVVAALRDFEARRAAGGPLPRSLPPGWRNNRWRPQDAAYRCESGTVEVRYVAREEGGFELEAEGLGATEAGRARFSAAGPAAGGERLAVELRGVRRRYLVAEAGARLFVHGPEGATSWERVPRFPEPRSEALAGGAAAPMTGVVRQICVRVGDRVEAGDRLVVLEAMKMEHVVVAHAPGVVREVRVEEGQMVDPDEVLIDVEPGEDS